MTKPAPQGLVLTDPTPRPPDLEKQYGTDPDSVKKQQAALRLRNIARHQQALTETARMLQLAEALKNDSVAHQQSGPTVPDAIKAAEIEKLAKNVRELLKSQ